MATEVTVRPGNFEQSIRDLKKKMQRELIFRAMRLASAHEPASDKKARKKEETERRIRKSVRRQQLEE